MVQSIKMGREVAVSLQMALVIFSGGLAAGAMASF